MGKEQTSSSPVPPSSRNFFCFFCLVITAVSKRYVMITVDVCTKKEQVAAHFKINQTGPTKIHVTLATAHAFTSLPTLIAASAKRLARFARCRFNASPCRRNQRTSYGSHSRAVLHFVHHSAPHYINVMALVCSLCLLACLLACLFFFFFFFAHLMLLTPMQPAPPPPPYTAFRDQITKFNIPVTPSCAKKKIYRRTVS